MQLRTTQATAQQQEATAGIIMENETNGPALRNN
jgi:hypothetical protein